MKSAVSRLNVLVTGAYGLIGNLVYARLAAQPELYAVSGLARDREPSARAGSINLHPIPDEHLRLVNISDFGAVQHAVAGIDIVVHLAADPDGQAGWESVLTNNIIGAHNVFEACRLAGVKRVVYASTNQVVFGYRADARYQPLFARPFDTHAAETPHLIDHTLPTRPLNDYACSKVYGEALAHMYAHKHGLSCICLRIGWVVPDDRVPSPSGASAG